MAIEAHLSIDEQTRFDIRWSSHLGFHARYRCVPRRSRSRGYMDDVEGKQVLGVPGCDVCCLTASARGWCRGPSGRRGFFGVPRSDYALGSRSLLQINALGTPGQRSGERFCAVADPTWRGHRVSRYPATFTSSAISARRGLASID